MSANQTIEWPGQSGKSYTHYIHPIETTFKDAPGNYVFAREASPGRWTPLYIGQTKSLNDRLSNHEKEDCARRRGATHIHAHVNTGGESARLTEEKDLIGKWKPPCNELLK
jgi:predicted GIY-YIG superfamily endonuclease